MREKRKKLKPGEGLVLWISRLIIWCVILITIIPLLFVVTASFNPTNTYFSSSLIPNHFSLNNYIKLFQDGQFLIWVKNSLIVGLSVAIGQVFFTATSAFAFSRLRFYGRKYGLMTLLILQMFPNFLAIAAIYGVLAKFGMIDSIAAYVLVMLGGSAYNIWLLKNYFDTVPKELDESAIIDGANAWQRFLKILLPLSMPMLVVIFLFTLMGAFGEYVLAGTIIQSPQNYTLGVGMYSMISGKFAQSWGEFSAAALLSALPLTIVFGLLQKYIASGLVAGSVKG
ncbi:sugar ABC transporter permease [Neobacillus ginsengisoli]|uniref:Arabinogalactan oligomer/maltooligosaccharide transport system permease protein n=1 Tax=Neobacillus ginsengisoli TaxID=904295 RepID=A0ABT9Y3H6_9BACI|nr:sugar ABC transporter permease [Neobacillus ginsengisoli]MDQ0202065.1 arabinogalactan oligomer/maltooligosaccharide transport system permease protein [Neobacillus ginsengisoli]